MDERLSVVSALPAPAPNLDHAGIAILQDWLALLLSGKITAIAIAGLGADGSISNEFSGAPHDILSAVVLLQHRITLGIHETVS